MRARFAALAVVVLIPGCGAGPPPDEAASSAQIAKVVLDWHRSLATGDGEAGCPLLTDDRQAMVVKSDRNLAPIAGRAPAGNCVEAVANNLALSESARAILLNTQVDAVRVDGERATATSHTSAVIDGVQRQVPSVTIPLRWDDGRWLID